MHKLVISFSILSPRRRRCRWCFLIWITRHVWIANRQYQQLESIPVVPGYKEIVLLFPIDLIVLVDFQRKKLKRTELKRYGLILIFFEECSLQYANKNMYYLAEERKLALEISRADDERRRWFSGRELSRLIASCLTGWLRLVPSSASPAVRKLNYQTW